MIVKWQISGSSVKYSIRWKLKNILWLKICICIKKDVSILDHRYQDFMRSLFAVMFEAYLASCAGSLPGNEYNCWQNECVVSCIFNYFLNTWLQVHIASFQHTYSALKEAQREIEAVGKKVKIYCKILPNKSWMIVKSASNQWSQHHYLCMNRRYLFEESMNTR